MAKTREMELEEGKQKKKKQRNESRKELRMERLEMLDLQPITKFRTPRSW